METSSAFVLASGGWVVCKFAVIQDDQIPTKSLLCKVQQGAISVCATIAMLGFICHPNLLAV